MSYTIDINQSSKKELSKLPKNIAHKVIEKILSLSDNPYPNGYKKMAGYGNKYRIRTGDYRVIYSIFDTQLIVHVIKIGHRKDIYK